ncbi:MAG: hypothetical protein ACW99U_10730 [Candidatus Thorarchaeota archaeon]|jgi:hypothetical protein
MENKTPFLLCLVGGILLFQVGWTGSLGIFSYLNLIETIPELVEFVWIVNVLLYVLAIVAGLGGIGVVVGGYLLTRGRTTNGRMIIGLALGMSIIGLVIQLAQWLWLYGATSVIDFFSLTAEATGWAGIILTLVGRSRAS